MSNRVFTMKPIVVASAAAFVLIAGPTAVEKFFDDPGWTTVAVAAEDGGGGSGSVNKGGHLGGRPEGKGGPKWEPGSSPWPEGKGPPPESDYWNRDGQPPRYGGDPEHSRKPGSATQGGRPQWASQELTDIGRLNVARAPEDVLLRAKDGGLDEISGDLTFYTNVAAILAKYDLSTEDGFNAAVSEVALLLRSDPTRVDSPLGNLAFYQDLISDGIIARTDGTVVLDATDLTQDQLYTLAAVFLGSAADKTLTVTADTVHAIDVIFEFEATTTPPENLDVAQDTTLALAADAVREAIQTVHDE
jgi:hypothetical protein